MPEYLAPGVFVEEVSFRQKTIEGVSTSTTGFVGPTRFGPVTGEPELLTSFADFERIYSGIDQLEWVDVSTGRMHNYIAQAVRAYFEEGGKRLYVARAYDALEDDPAAEPAFSAGRWSDGRARWTGGSPPDVEIVARYPGAAGNLRITFVFRLGQNVLDTNEPTVPSLRGAANYDVVFARTEAEATDSPPSGGELCWIERYFDEGLQRDTFRLRQDDPQPGVDPVGAVGLGDLGARGTVQVLTVSVLVGPMGRFGQDQVWQDLSFHPEHRRALGNVFAPNPTQRTTELYVPLVLTTGLGNGAALAEFLAGQTSLAPGSPPPTILDSLVAAGTTDAARTFRIELIGGNDGNRPGAPDYEGDEGDADGRKSGLRAFEDLEDISILAAPGSSHADGDILPDAVSRLLISHCERMRYRVAVLDSINGQTPGEVRETRGRIDTTRAALYYPWVRVLDPVTETEILLPPSGFVAGIYARNDVERGVHKAPANEPVHLALGFEILLNKAQQEALNPEGINCLRFFEGRGFRVWGARTTSSDPEWKYLNVRRYFAYLERSIDKGSQWAVFEPNGDALWGNVRRTVEDFLFNEWKSNRLLGLKPEEAFFVRCDRTTMTLNDLDNGRLVCLVGVAPLRPAEFVIFRIGQKTADNRS